MDIDALIRELGPVDSDALGEAILGLDEEVWREERLRRRAYNVHWETETIVMLFTDLSEWPSMTVQREPGWDRLADVAVPVMHDIIGRCYPQGGTIIRAMAAKLVAGGKIRPHADTHPSFHLGHHIHVPITSNPRVRLMIDGRPHQLQVGKAYEINNQKNHSMMNKGTEDRITFIFDYIPPNELTKIRSKTGQSTTLA